MNTRLKAEWVRKLIKTKSFIVVTDDDAVMEIRGTKPTRLSMYELAVQRAHLSAFRDRLSGLIKRHDDLLGLSKKLPKKPVKKAVHITVKKG